MVPEYVPCNELKKKVDYWLTYDFYPRGGTKVRVVKSFPAKNYFQGLQGQAVIVMSENKTKFVVLPGNVLFASDPSKECANG